MSSTESVNINNAMLLNRRSSQHPEARTAEFSDCSLSRMITVAASGGGGVCWS